MNRTEFARKAISLILLALLAGVTILLGKRSATGYDCSLCPGKGICKGKSDCSTYIP
jgi:hypothetical protein